MLCMVWPLQWLWLIGWSRASTGLNWQPSYFHMAIAMASAYARRHCYDLRVYRFTSARVDRFAATRGARTAHLGKHGIACSHPQLGGRAGSWCKLAALHDTLMERAPGQHQKLDSQGEVRRRYEFVVFVDSDAFFHDTAVSIPRNTESP